MKVDILTPLRYGGPRKWGDDLVKILEENNIEARNIYNFWEIIKRFFWTDADIIHTTLPLFFSFHRKRIILTIHGDYRREKNIWKYFWPLAIKNAKKITVPSNFLKNELKLNTAIVIPNSVNLDEFPKIIYIPKSIVTFITITNFNFIDKINGLTYLIKIFDELSLKSSNFKFIIIGGGRYLDSFKEEYHNREFIHFLGFSNNVKQIIKECDIFVYYSLHDNFPIVILEAMASGLPVVSNNIGAIEEIISHGEDGFVFEDDFAFINKILELIEDPSLRSEIGLRAINKVKNYFNSSILSKFLEVYE